MTKEFTQQCALEDLEGTAPCEIAQGQKICTGFPKCFRTKQQSELTTNQFAELHGCTIEEAVKLRRSYWQLVPSCTNPFAILSAILGTKEEGEKDKIDLLKNRLEQLVSSRENNLNRSVI